MKLTLSILGVVILALILAILNVNVLDYDPDTKDFSYNPRLLEFSFDFKTKTLKTEQTHNPLFITTLLLGFAGMVLSPVAYIKEKDGPVCLLIGGIGFLAVLWQLFMIIAIVGIILGITITIWWQSE